MEILIPKKNVILDATMLSTLMSCARKYEFQFQYHLQPADGKSPSLEMGSIVHTYLEYYYKHVIEGTNKKDAHGYGMAAAQTYAASGEVQNTGEEDKALALDTCELYNEHYKNDSWTPLTVESSEMQQIYEDDEIRVGWAAKFDLKVDHTTGILPVDHKTMKQRRDSLHLNNQFIGQCILSKTRTMMINKVGFQKSLKPKDRFTRVIMNYTLDLMTEWQSEIVPYWAKVLLSYKDSGYFPPNWTNCENKFGFCPFKDVCGSNPNMRQYILENDFKVGEAWSI